LKTEPINYGGKTESSYDRDKKNYLSKKMIYLYVFTRYYISQHAVFAQGINE